MHRGVRSRKREREWGYSDIGVLFLRVMSEVWERIWAAWKALRWWALMGHLEHEEST